MRHKKILSHAPEFRNAIIFPREEKRGKALKWDLRHLFEMNKGKKGLSPLNFLGKERRKRKKHPTPCDFFALLTA